MSELIRITKIEPIFTEIYSDSSVVADCDILHYIEVEFKAAFENMEIKGTYRYDTGDCDADDYEGLSINDYKEHIETLLGKLTDKIADAKGR